MIETYIPLYRKYRPQSFADVVGQGPIIQTLSNAITLEKVAHAYLFTGSRGTGKTSTARIFAKSLNCENGPTVSPCQTCASCVGITAGNGLDVVEFDAASNNGVDDARELIENCQYSPMSGKFKIYIIDEVHMLTTNAFNALLKTLEEPPANVVFIFATTEAHKVLPTIISRCQRFDFSRITHSDIVQRLAWIAQQEEVSIEQEALAIIARHARGGLRDAVGLLDQVSVLARSQPGKVVQPADVTRFIGGLAEDTLVRLSAAIAQRQVASLMTLLQELTQHGIEPPQLVKELSLHFRHLLFVKAGGESATADQFDLSGSYFDQLKQQVSFFEIEELPQVLSRLAALDRQLRHTQQPQLWLEVGLIELAYRDDIFLVKELARRVESLEARFAEGLPTVVTQAAKTSPPRSEAAPIKPAMPAPSLPSPAPPTITTPQEKPEQADRTMAANTTTAAAPVDANLNDVSQLYAQICQQVTSPTVRPLLTEHTFAIALEGDLLTIGCTSQPLMENLKQPKKMIHLEKAAELVLGKPMRLNLIVQAGQKPPMPPVMAAKIAEPSPSMAQPPNVKPEPPPAPPLEAESIEDEVSHEPMPALIHQVSPFSGEDEDEALVEAKKMALQLLQGRVLE